MNSYSGTSLSTGLLVVAMATSTSAMAVDSSYLTEKLHTNAIKFHEAPYSVISTAPTIGPNLEHSRQTTEFYNAVSGFYESLLLSQKAMNSKVAEQLSESAWDLYLE